MTDGLAYEYAILRVVPRAERGELANVGVILYCQQADLLAVAHRLDEARLRALHPDVDLPGLRTALDAITAICHGEERAGPAGRQPRGSRFRWLTAPRSTVVQPGPVHGGVTDDPTGQLERLMARLVD